MEIIEHFILGKAGLPDLCEDGLVTSPDLIAVIDGVTAKGHRKWDGASSGFFAKELLFRKLEAYGAVLSGEKLLCDLSRSLSAAAASAGSCATPDLPKASIIVYSPAAGKIWSYGDCQCMINGVPHSHAKVIDTLLSEKRAAVIGQCILEKGLELTMRLLQSHDFARDEILDELKRQSDYENRHVYVEGRDLGYPVINGSPIVPDMIAEYSVLPGDEVILASDGYPFLMPTLAQSEQELSRLLREDPHCYKEYKSTKGLTAGNLSFDDRTYIRFRA